MHEIRDLTLAQTKDYLKNKQISAIEVTKAYLEYIEKAKKLNIFIHPTPDIALGMAKIADQKIASGEQRDLEGIPIAVKDIFATKNIHTQACSYILDNFKPPYESTVTSNLWDKGAVMLGKLNMDEFAMGSSNESSHYGPAVSPWPRADWTIAENKKALNSNKEGLLVPGGSSGGSAAAVAAKICCGALGSDTGGSIRQPAAFTGTVGVNPTYGLCSRWGMIAFASSLDQAGPIAKNVLDSAILLKAIAGHDHKDTTSANVQIPNYEEYIGKSIQGKRIGVPKEYSLEKMDPEIKTLWQQGIKWLKDAKAEIINVSIPHMHYSLPAYCIIAPAEASSNLARFDGIKYGLRVDGKDITSIQEQTRAKGFGKEVKNRLLFGTYVLSSGNYNSYYIHALKVRQIIKQEFQQIFNNKIDAILTPTTPLSAFPITKDNNNPVNMYNNDIFTVPANIAGLPAINIPAGISKNNLPLGLQLIGQPFNEKELFTVAAVIEKSAPKITMPSPWWE